MQFTTLKNTKQYEEKRNQLLKSTIERISALKSLVEENSEDTDWQLQVTTETLLGEIDQYFAPSNMTLIEADIYAYCDREDQWYINMFLDPQKEWFGNWRKKSILSKKSVALTNYIKKKD